MPSGYLHFGGPLHAQRVNVPGAPDGHTHREPDRPGVFIRHQYHKRILSEDFHGAAVYVVRGYTLTPSDLDLIASG